MNKKNSIESFDISPDYLYDYKYKNTNINSFFSQRTEVLLFRLLEKLSAQSSPFKRQTIIVQNSGMQRYLEIKIAQSFGICSHIDIIYPASFIWQVRQEINKSLDVDDNNFDYADYKKRYLVYKIVEALAKQQIDNNTDINGASFDYLTKNYPSQKNQFNIASSIADIFLKYLTERPEIIDLWENGKSYSSNNEHEKWQKELYLSLNLSSKTRLKLQKKFYNNVRDFAVKNNSIETTYHNSKRQNTKQQNYSHQTSFDFDIEKLNDGFDEYISNNQLKKNQSLNQLHEPSSQTKTIDEIHIFGFHFMPKVQLQDFLALSEIYKLNFYVINPSIEYWSDIKTTSAQIKEQLLSKNKDSSDIETVLNFNDELIEKSYKNTLLANLGQSGRYLLEKLLDFNYENLDETLQLNKTVSDNYLDFLQNSIRNSSSTDNTITRESHNNITDRFDSGISNDDSIMVIKASNIRREVEILRDNILTMLEENDDLSPSDILVMVPKISDYALQIKSVFGQSGDNNYVAYSIANQSSSEQDSKCQSFLLTINLISDKFSNEAFFKFFTQPNIIDYFELSKEDIETFVSWTNNNLNWGFDAEFKAEFLKNDVMNQQGNLTSLVDNLISSYLMITNTAFYASNNSENNLLITDENNTSFTPNQYQSLEKLINILLELSKIQRLAFEKLTVSQWRDKLMMIANLFQKNTAEISKVQQLLFKWEEELLPFLEKDLIEKNSEINNDISVSNQLYDFNFIASDMNELFSHEVLRGPFLSGGISFCSLTPMRAIPAQVIAILGLNESFPNYMDLANFDLTKNNPQLSDRNSSKETKFMFLETILSTRKTLYLSYIAINEITGESLAPSILIQTLVSFLKEKIPNFNYNKILKNNFLQAFNSQYYTESDTANDQKILHSFNDLYELKHSNNALNTNNKITDKNNNEQISKNDLISNDFITIANLVAMFSNPLIEYMKNQKGLRINNRMHLFNNNDFIMPSNNLEEWALTNTLLQSEQLINNHINNTTLNNSKDNELSKTQNLQQLSFAKLKQQNILPPEPFASKLFEEEHLTISSYLNYFNKFQKNDLTICESIKLDFISNDNNVSSDDINNNSNSGNSIFIRFDEFDELGLRISKFSKLKAEDYLIGWFSHLFFNYLFFIKPYLFAATYFSSRKTRVIRRDKIIVFDEISDLVSCKKYLVDIFSIYSMLQNEVFNYYLIINSEAKNPNLISYQNIKNLKTGDFDNRFISDSFFKLLRDQIDITDEELENQYNILTNFANKISSLVNVENHG